MVVGMGVGEGGIGGKRSRGRRGKCVCVRERLGAQVCVRAALYKEGQWRGSGIIWRGRCCNILSWITTLYTAETDGEGDNRQAAGAGGGWGEGRGRKKGERDR